MAPTLFEFEFDHARTPVDPCGRFRRHIARASAPLAQGHARHATPPRPGPLYTDHHA